MYPTHDRHHASLPIDQAHVSVTYCPVCMSWRVVAWSTSSESDDHSELHYSREIDCGPFDTLDDVLAVAKTHLDIAAALPAGPGFMGRNRGFSA